MKRLISTSFWNNLTRIITKENIVDMAKDTKIKESWIDDQGKLHENQESHRIYVPYNRKINMNFQLIRSNVQIFNWMYNIYHRKSMLIILNQSIKTRVIINCH